MLPYSQIFHYFYLRHFAGGVTGGTSNVIPSKFRFRSALGKKSSLMTLMWWAFSSYGVAVPSLVTETRIGA
jgi:hypothetical protein